MGPQIPASSLPSFPNGRPIPLRIIFRGPAGCTTCWTRQLPDLRPRPQSAGPAAGTREGLGLCWLQALPQRRDPRPPPLGTPPQTQATTVFQRLRFRKTLTLRPKALLLCLCVNKTCSDLACVPRDLQQLGSGRSLTLIRSRVISAAEKVLDISESLGGKAPVGREETRGASPGGARAGGVRHVCPHVERATLGRQGHYPRVTVAGGGPAPAPQRSFAASRSERNL